MCCSTKIQTFSQTKQGQVYVQFSDNSTAVSTLYHLAAKFCLLLWSLSDRMARFLSYFLIPYSMIIDQFGNPLIIWLSRRVRVLT